MTSLALSCLIIASKYCENDPNVPQLPFFIKTYNSIVDVRYQNTIVISDLIYNEIKICKILKYRLHYYTIYDYNSFFFSHGILKLEQIKDIKYHKGMMLNGDSTIKATYDDLDIQPNDIR